jgi:hypothetical protein
VSPFQVASAESRESEIDTTATEPAPPSTNHRSPPPHLAPNLARTIIVVVFGSYTVIAFLRIFYQGYGPPSRIVLSTAYLIPMLWLQLYVFGRPQVQFRRPVLYIALLCQAMLVYAAIAYSCSRTTSLNRQVTVVIG